MTDNLEAIAARPIWQARMALDLRKGCAKVREGRRQALSLVALGLGSEMATKVPGFDLEAFKRACGPM